MRILITGARSNIGYLTAKTLSLRGHIVYVGCKTLLEKKTLEEKLKEEKIIMFPIVINLLDDNNLIINKLSLDAIFLHASIGNGGSILELSIDRLKEVIDINILGNYKLIQNYLRYCYYNKRSGKIFLTSSLGAFYSIPYLSSYTASKLYLINLINTLKLEVKYLNLNIKVSLILPGAYYTGFNDIMINNKYKDNLIIPSKANFMSLYQKFIFNLIESTNYNKLVLEIVKQMEKDNPKYIISSPYYQKLFTKLYTIIKLLIV